MVLESTGPGVKDASGTLRLGNYSRRCRFGGEASFEVDAESPQMERVIFVKNLSMPWFPLLIYVSQTPVILDRVHSTSTSPRPQHGSTVIPFARKLGLYPD
jgi:hypothetical protein